MNVKAIETCYAGYRFRSRLEARWAVFFDHLGLEWQYEPQGFEFDVAGKPRRYLPDFWFPQIDVWCEVKGSEETLDLELLAYAAHPETGLPRNPEGDPALSDSAGSRRNAWNGQYGWPWPVHRLVLLGPIPENDRGSSDAPVRFHTLLQARMTARGWSVCACVAAFTSFRAFMFAQTPETMLLTAEREYIDPGYGLTSESLWYGPTRGANNAYTAARTARFEHGESGAQQ